MGGQRHYRIRASRAERDCANECGQRQFQLHIFGSLAMPRERAA
jgi:hypothetical protein